MDFLIALPLGFVLGFLIGLTGIGGGALVAPAIYVVLGRPYGEAVTLSLVYSLFTKVFSAYQHVRQGTVLWRITLAYGVLGIPGAIVGSRAVYWGGGAAQRVLPFVMGGVLILVAALIVLEAGVRSVAARPKPFSPHRLHWPLVVSVGVFQLIVGALLGLASIGSGSLIILSMLYLFDMSAKQIVGSNLVIALIMVIPAGLTHYLAGGADWRLLAVLLVGSVGGGILGAKSTMIVGDRTLKFVIAALILLGAVATIVKAW